MRHDKKAARGQNGSAQVCDNRTYFKFIAPLREDKPALTGDRNQCPSCSLLFNSLSAFDKHRIGKFGIDRRCMTESEMTAVGMQTSHQGYWVTQLMDEKAKSKVYGRHKSAVISAEPTSDIPLTVLTPEIQDVQEDDGNG